MTDFVIDTPHALRDFKAVSRREIPDEDMEKGLENQMTFDVVFRNDIIGAFTLAPMPGCCGVVVSTGSYIREASRSIGIGEEFHALKAHVARKLGYSRMIATVQTSNFPEIIGAAKAGWTLNKAFTNRRTGNQLVVMEKSI